MTSTREKHLPWLTGTGRFLWPSGPARRKRWVVAGAVVLALLAVHTGWAVLASGRLMRTADRLAGEWGDMVPGSLAPPPVADQDNAARAVRAAIEMVSLPERAIGNRFQGSMVAFGSYMGAEPTPGQLAALREQVAANDIALELLDEAARRVGATWNLRYADGMSVAIPDLLRLIDTARLNVTAGRLSVREGDDMGVVQALVRGTALSRSLGPEPILIVQLTRFTIQRFHHALLREWLTARSPSSGKLDAVARAYALESPTSLRAAFIGEAKIMVD